MPNLCIGVSIPANMTAFESESYKGKVGYKPSLIP